MKSTLITVSILLTILLIVLNFGYKKYQSKQKELAISSEDITNFQPKSVPFEANQGSSAPDISESMSPEVSETIQEFPSQVSSEMENGSDSSNAITQCQKLSSDINNFFDKLSEQRYIKAYEIDENISTYMNRLIVNLLNNPPVIASEGDDLLSILKNTAHFYRIIGAKNISLFKDILLYESDNIEFMMATFYDWSMNIDNCPEPDIEFYLPLEKTYEYSSFFLNTLGGQSYLFRRESRLRLLIKYYCLLIVSRAEQQGLNRHGIDITNDIETTIEDLSESYDLINQNEYLENLMRIKGKITAQASPSSI